MRCAIALLALAMLASTAAAGPIGLTVALDRAAPVYATGDGLAIVVTTARAAAIRVWLRDPAGRLTPLYPAMRDAEPLSIAANTPMRLPRNGDLRVTPPSGNYELLVSAESPVGGARSLTSADARLARRDLREQRTVVFTVEDPR